jgi:hypothetical protein
MEDEIVLRRSNAQDERGVYIAKWAESPERFAD